ncbi:hypothetical protein N7513_009449 [Penicillium frequentans]|nr:hypothetical protein N7513_009449 [Penicillium glabrum]
MAQNMTPKRSRIQWDTTKRQVLCCLYRFFSWEKQVLCRVFSEIFREHLLELGINTDLSYPLLHTQWSGMRLESNPVWFHVHVDTEFRNDAEWKTRISEIKATASRLGVYLQEKAWDNIDKSKSQNFDCENDKSLRAYFESILLSDQNPTNTSTQQATQSPVQQSSDNRTVTLNSPLEMPIRRKTESLVSSNGKLCFWCHKEGIVCSEDERQPSDVLQLDTIPGNGYLPGTHSPEIIQEYEPPTHDEPTLDENERLPGACSAENLPPLLFRWSNADSQGVNSKTGYCAGLFAKADSTSIDLAQLTQKQYLGFFKNHVTKAKVSSPFISTFTLPLSPVHRALHHQKGAIIAIIDTSKLKTMVVKANILVPLTQTETKRWKGYGEYLIWREIPEAAIACVFTIKNFELIANGCPLIKEFLQLELIRSRTFSGMYLYCELARRLKNTTNHHLILERLATSLNVPAEYTALVINRFEVAWMRAFGDNLNFELAEDRPFDDAMEIENDIEMTNEGLWTRHRFEYKGEEQSGASTYAPSRTDLDHSSESEEQPQEENGSASPEALARRRDTPSPPFSTRDSPDDDEPWYSHRVSEEEEMTLEGGGLQDVQLCTPSSHNSYQTQGTQETMLISPVPFDFEKESSWPPLDKYA